MKGEVWPSMGDRMMRTLVLLATHDKSFPRPEKLFPAGVSNDKSELQDEKELSPRNSTGIGRQIDSNED
jgi:hypothetical protein